MRSCEGGGELLADLVRERADDRPHGIVRVLGFQRQIEAHELFVALHQFECLGARADLLGDAVQFIVKDIAQALREDERKNKLLVLWGVLRAADGTGSVPDPGFE